MIIGGRYRLIVKALLNEGKQDEKQDANTKNALST